jgi:ribosome maturation factor RimP
MGYELVQVRMLGGARRTLQVMAEPLDRRRAMTVDDCAEISHALSALLDVHDPIPGSYVLEVSSPGIDRPLVRPRDYERFAGHLAKVETAEEVAGRRRFRGVIGEVRGDVVRLHVAGETVEVPFAAIRKAKLVLTDELLAASRRPADE